jgi:hypothetical protein
VSEAEGSASVILPTRVSADGPGPPLNCVNPSGIRVHAMTS